MTPSSSFLRRKSDSSAAVFERAFEQRKHAPLAFWLRRPQSYPPDFGFEELIETPRSFLAVGREHVYKFRKHAAAENSSFTAVWRAACEELADQYSWGPALVVGLRTLQTNNGADPLWGDFISTTNADPLKPDSRQGAVSVVMRKLAPEAAVSRVLECHPARTPLVCSEVARAVAETQHRNNQQAAVNFLSDPHQMLKVLRRRYLTGLDEFSREALADFSPFVRFSLLEAKGFIRRYFERNEKQIFERGRQGCLIDGHGDLRAEHVFLCRRPNTRSEIAFIGRQPRGDLHRLGDRLGDVASLAADLYIAGRQSAAESLVEAYRAVAGEQADENYVRLLLCASCLERACSLWRGEELIAVEAALEQAAKFISQAFSFTLTLRRPFVLVFGGEQALELEQAESGICELLGDKVRRLSFHRHDRSSGADFFGFESLVSVLERELSDQRSVVIQSPGLDYLRRCRLAEVSERFKANLVYVHCVLGLAERISRSKSPPALPREAVTETNGLIVEPSLSAEELARIVLERLSDGR